MFIIAAFYPFRVQLVGGLHRLIGQNLYCRVHHPLYYSQNSTKSNTVWFATSRTHSVVSHAIIPTITDDVIP